MANMIEINNNSCYFFGQDSVFNRDKKGFCFYIVVSFQSLHA